VVGHQVGAVEVRQARQPGFAEKVADDRFRFLYDRLGRVNLVGGKTAQQRCFMACRGLVGGQIGSVFRIDDKAYDLAVVDIGQFFGRSDEKALLVSLVVSTAFHLFHVHAQSSLVRADAFSHVAPRTMIVFAGRG